MEKLAIIIGPTAVGKTALSVEIASLIDAEIISGDSMQVYRGMDIGTAKIEKSEMFAGDKFIKHHFIDILEPWENYSVARFQKEAKAKIREVNLHGKIPIIVGGTGLYIQSIIDPYEFITQDRDEDYRKDLSQLAEQHGKEYVHNLLKEVDEISAKNIHPNNLKRVIRALEVFHVTGKPISTNHTVDFSKPALYELAYVGLNTDKEELHKRIEERVDKMIEDGLVDEVQRLLLLPNRPSQTALQALGYKEIVAYLEGKTTLEEAIYRIKIETKRFAKRQLTWFKRDKRIKWYCVTKESNIKELALEISHEICRTININVE